MYASSVVFEDAEKDGETKCFLFNLFTSRAYLNNVFIRTYVL